MTEMPQHRGPLGRRAVSNVSLAIVLTSSVGLLASCSGGNAEHQTVVPNLIGLRPVPAIRVLCSAGLVPGRLTALPPGASWTGKPDDTNGSMGVSRVVRQAPAAGTKVDRGTRVPYAFVAPSNWSFQKHPPAACEAQQRAGGSG